MSDPTPFRTYGDCGGTPFRCFQNCGGTPFIEYNKYSVWPGADSHSTSVATMDGGMLFPPKSIIRGGMLFPPQSIIRGSGRRLVGRHHKIKSRGGYIVL